MFRAGIIFSCFACPTTLSTRSEWDAHILDHFRQKHCTGCGNNLLCIGDTWYQPHNDLCLDVKHGGAACRIPLTDPIETIEPEDMYTEVETKFLPEYDGFQEEDEMEFEDNPTIPDDSNTNTKQKRAEPNVNNQQKSNNDPTWECSRCNIQFQHIRLLQAHSHIHELRDAVNRHQIATHPIFDSDAFAANHNDDEISRIVECDGCARPYRNLIALMKHKRLVHSDGGSGEREFKCIECDESFEYIMQLVKHMRLHTEMKRFTCYLCKRSYNAYDDFYCHVYQHGTDMKHVKRSTVYSCTECDTSTRSPLTLIIHMKTHLNLAKFACFYDFCKEQFDGYGALYDHIIEHQQNDYKNKQSRPKKSTRRKNYSKERVTCDICQKTLYDKSSMRKHMIAIHMEKAATPTKMNYMCEICKTSYRTATHLENHIRQFHVHGREVEEKEYECCGCSASFQTVHLLIRHLKKHSSLAEFSCRLSDCGGKFQSLHEFQQHLEQYKCQARE